MLSQLLTDCSGSFFCDMGRLDKYLLVLCPLHLHSQQHAESNPQPFNQEHRGLSLFETSQDLSLRLPGAAGDSPSVWASSREVSAIRWSHADELSCGWTSAPVLLERFSHCSPLMPLTSIGKVGVTPEKHTLTEEWLGKAKPGPYRHM